MLYATGHGGGPGTKVAANVAEATDTWTLLSSGELTETSKVVTIRTRTPLGNPNGENKTYFHAKPELGAFPADDKKQTPDDATP